MKRFLTVILALAMVLTMSAPVFADGIDAAAPAELTAAQVKAMKPAAKAASYSYTKIKVSWDKIEGVDGYKVYRATKKSGKYSLVKTAADPDTTSYINTDRTTGKIYYYKVRAYKVDGKIVYTKYSDIKSAYARPSKVKINKVYLPKNKQVKVTWIKVSGATGYQIYRKRVDKSNWKLFKSVSSKSASVIDPLRQKIYVKGNSGAYYYDDTDLDYDWEYKVRAYRIVNGKKVYGLFSTPAVLTPEWTMEEIYETAWKYVEGLEWPLYEYANPDGSENEDGEYVVPKKDGTTYNLKHIIGWTSNEDIGGDAALVFTNPAHGNTVKSKDFVQATPDNSSWFVGWPFAANKYMKRGSVIKQLKESLKADIDFEIASNPLYWGNASIEGVEGPNGEDRYLTGTEYFTIYYEKYKNGYKIWLLW